MIKTTVDKPLKKHLFQKGNKFAKGRPNGALCEHKKKFLEIQKLAANDAQKVYAELRECMQLKEEWAYQIYWKVLYKLPRAWQEETVKVDLPTLSKKEGIDTYLSKFIDALSVFDEYSKEDIFAAIKSLNSVKMTETINDNTTIESKEELTAKLQAINKIIAFSEGK